MVIPLLRKLLLPFSWLYGIVVEGIKLTYRLGWKKSKRFEVPMVVVGNLSTGGTGKTPHVEYILKTVGNYYHISVLSRGYGRTTKGLRWVSPDDKAIESGDEPLQIAQKYPNVPVVVAEKRAAAVPQILNRQPQTQLLLLDDAMQHWPISGDSYLMLSTYEQPFFTDFVLPAGNLREFRFNYKRANIILITKCPPNITPQQRRKFLHKLRPKRGQQVFFSYFKYGIPYAINDNKLLLSWELLNSYTILLISGIANPSNLIEEIKQYTTDITAMEYKDHHNYSRTDWDSIESCFHELQQAGKPALILSTEKDAVRLRPFYKQGIPLYIIPIEVEIAFNQGTDFQRSLIEVIYKKRGYPRA